MQIAFYCPHCKLKLEIEMEDAGTEAQCPRCSKSFLIPEAEIGAGVTIGGFRILRKLGQGAMGEVYLARQRSMDREVALKILPYQMTLQKNLVERFLHEVKMIARVEHPHIVTAYKAGEDNGVYFLAMHYVAGESLDRELNRRIKLPEAEALPIVRTIAEALGFAWDQHHILHRDIKPGNIMMDKNRRPLVLDLGLSKTLDGAEGLTVNEMVIGTPNYMSPEQVRGDKSMDTRADMYGLGATLYHMVTGQIPFSGLGLMETLRKQAMESLPDPRDFSPGLSASTVALMEHMLAKNADHRYPRWADLIDDIDRAIRGETLNRRALGVGQSMLDRSGPSTGSHPPASAHSREIGSRTTSARPRPSWFIPALSATVCGILIAASFWMLLEARRYYQATARLHEKMFGSAPALHSGDPSGPPPVPALEAADLEAEFEQIMQLLHDHPGRSVEVQRRLRHLRQRAQDTPIARMADDALRRLREE